VVYFQREKMSNLRIALAQINCTLGDLEGNIRKIKEYIKKAKELKVDIISFPELAICGYPPEDLLLQPKFVEDNLEKLKELITSIDEIVVIIGFVDREDRELYNSAAVIYDKEIKGIYHKIFLPNYSVFDEKRYFKPGDKPLVFKFGRFIFGVSICEDIWHREGPTREQALLGAKLLFNINASPYHLAKFKQREEILKSQAKENKVFIAYTNLVGGQDELIFDGQSMVVDEEGKVIGRAETFKEDLLMLDLDISRSKSRTTKTLITITDKRVLKKRIALLKKTIKIPGLIEEIYQALLLGVRDYVSKNGFQKVVIGLSGGIDSSLVATIACDALGKENVSSVFMPSPYTSEESNEDVKLLVKNLGIKLINIPIEEIYKTYLMILEPNFRGLEKDITEENIQARIRGNILMALSNKFGWLVLTTGNKSEMSTGYATLYGDMAGGFSVIKDIPKTLVYKLAKYRNSITPVIPERILTKEPSAELKPNQKDKDTLPPYEILDPILKAYIEEDKNRDEIVSLGFDTQTVKKVISMVDKSEYKRRQAPPGIKITPKAFGKDRRMPITNKYRG